MDKSCDKNKDVDSMKILEDALVLCKFGRFHILLMFISFMSVFATIAVNTATSFVLPSAECDLDMNIMQKGILNGVPFMGQICTAFFTGFLIDTFGRKPFLVGGNFCMFAFAILAASSQNYAMMLTAKLLEGIVMSVGFAATSTMVSEYSHRGVRDRVFLFYSSFACIAIAAAAAMAWLILPYSLHIVVIKGYLELHSWNFYLLSNSTWSFIAAVLYTQIPESPKFLLTHGQENEALCVIRKIYKINTGKAKSTFPITTLGVTEESISKSKLSFKKQIVDGLCQVKQLFRGSTFHNLILFSTITFVCLFSYSAVRLWFPQLSVIMENYYKTHDTNTQFCDIINDYQQSHIINVTNPESAYDRHICIPTIPGAETYTNGIILGLISIICITISGFLVNFTGQKPLMFIFLILSSLCLVAIKWTYSSVQTAILISLMCGFIITACILVQNIMIRVFPTSVRTMTFSLIVMIGRIGSVTGSVLFPVLLEMGCMVPFFTFSAAVACATVLVFFSPNPRTQNAAGDK